MARILYVSQGYNTHDRRFLEKLAETLHEVWLIPCVTDPVLYETRPTPPGIHRLPPLRNSHSGQNPIAWLVSLVRLRRWIRSIKPDLIHAGPIQSGGFLAALLGFHPLLIMSWGSDVLVVPEKNRLMRWVTEFTLHRADMVLGDCKGVQDRVLSLSPLRPEQVVFFPWGVDIDQFHPRLSSLSLRKKLGWEDCQVVISTRSFEPIHGTLVFLEAIHKVIQKRPDVRVLMLGDGSLRPQVKNFIHEHALIGHVYMPGQVTHPLLPDYFNEADLYVSATYSDGTSISLLEAMACGLAVIATDGYGNREWVLPRVNGWLYPAGDAQALSEAVLEALNDKQRRQAMGGANLTLTHEKADWDKNSNKLLMIYNRLLANV